ncbi:MAG: polysaccharide biosynthesis/export family protein [Sphingomonadales bacterium]|nr:polysaccharide biosynthesis/export family protein [Sphingomonadales bacterium]
MSLWKQGALAAACAAGTCVIVIPTATAQTIAPAAVAPAASTAPAATAPAAAAPTGPGPSGSAPGINTSTYRINPGDELEIYVWGEERLQRTVKVLPDGTLAFPLVGQLKVQGMLPHDLELAVSDRLKDQYRGQVPQVTVSIKAPTGLQFSVMGKVRSPGTFSPGRYTTILEALSLAGGPGEFANLDGVVVLRKQGGHMTTLRYKLNSLFKSGTGNIDAAQAEIEPGDMIIVP